MKLAAVPEVMRQVRVASVRLVDAERPTELHAPLEIVELTAELRSSPADEVERSHLDLAQAELLRERERAAPGFEPSLVLASDIVAHCDHQQRPCLAGRRAELFG